MHGINVAEAGGASTAAATRQPNNIVSSPTGRASIRLTRKLAPPTDRDGSPTKNNLESTPERIFSGPESTIDVRTFVTENFPGERAGQIYFREGWNYFLIPRERDVRSLDLSIEILNICFVSFSFRQMLLEGCQIGCLFDLNLISDASLPFWSLLIFLRELYWLFLNIYLPEKLE